MRVRSFTAGALTMLAALSGVDAQQAPPIFRAGTAVVEVTVIVRDRAGRFVRGLSPDDFDVREGGQPRRIQTIYLVEGSGRVSAPANRSQASPEPAVPRTFVFFFDVDHLSPSGLTRARDAVRKFGTDRLLTTDLSSAVISGVTTAGRVSNDHRATLDIVSALKPRSDRSSREAGLRQWPRIITPAEAAEIAANIQQTLERARDRGCIDKYGSIDPCLGPSVIAEANRTEVEQELRLKARIYVSESRVAAERSVSVVSELARVLEAIRGRKTILWFAESTWPEEVAERARQAAVRASQSGVAVYTVDPRGLGRQAERAMDNWPAEAGVAFLQDMDDITSVMAAGSGGLSIRNENNLARALAAIEEDTSTYYVIGYAADDGDNPSLDKPLAVRVRNADNGTRVRYGFMAPRQVGTAVGSMHATPLTNVPGSRRELGAPTPPPAPPLPPSTTTTGPTSTHVPTTASSTEKVLRLRGLSDDSAPELSARAWAAYERGDLEAALPLFEQAASRADVRPWALYALGFAYVGSARPRDAVAAWERVRTSAPDFQPVYLDLASHYAQLSETGRALDVLRAAELRWPADPEVHNGIGVLMVRRQAFGDAIASFTKATELAAADALSWLNLGRAYELRYDRLRRYDEQLLKWVGPEGDRVKAQQSYQRCVALGGPYAAQAADALARMAWSQ